MSLKAQQTAALAALKTLLLAVTNVRAVIVGVPEQMGEPFTVTISDDGGLYEERASSNQFLHWDILIQAYVAGSGQPGFADAYQAAWDLRGDLMDALDNDITIASTVSRSEYRGPVKVCGLITDGGDRWVGVDLPYRLRIDQGRTFG